MGMFRVLIYGIIFGAWAASLTYDILYMPQFYRQWWIAKLIFMSMINFTLQTFYFGMCFVRALVDSLGETKDKGPHTRHPTVPSYWHGSKLHRVCDFVYATSAFPLGFATAFLFWTLYVVDPTLVVPTWATRIIPKWHNHMTHTASIPFLLVDTLLTCHHMPSKVVGSSVIVALTLFYYAIIVGVKLIDGFWLYPIFDALDVIQRATFMLGGGVVFWLLYMLGDVLNAMLWGKASHAGETRPSVVKKKM